MVEQPHRLDTRQCKGDRDVLVLARNEHSLASAKTRTTSTDLLRDLMLIAWWEMPKVVANMQIVIMITARDSAIRLRVECGERAIAHRHIPNWYVGRACLQSQCTFPDLCGRKRLPTISWGNHLADIHPRVRITWRFKTCFGWHSGHSRSPAILDSMSVRTLATTSRAWNTRRSNPPRAAPVQFESSAAS